jgi:hypothetical protein
MDPGEWHKCLECVVVGGGQNSVILFISVITLNRRILHGPDSQNLTEESTYLRSTTTLTINNQVENLAYARR